MGQYEFSSIELNAEHQIYVDYNMGMRVNLVDRSIYNLEPDTGLDSNKGPEHY
jgi:hypothetical protein